MSLRSEVHADPPTNPCNGTPVPARVSACFRTVHGTWSVHLRPLHLAVGAGIRAPSWTSAAARHLKSTNKSYRVDETYIKVKRKDRYLYRAVDSTGQDQMFRHTGSIS